MDWSLWKLMVAPPPSAGISALHSAGPTHTCLSFRQRRPPPVPEGLIAGCSEPHLPRKRRKHPIDFATLM